MEYIISDTEFSSDVSSRATYFKKTLLHTNFYTTLLFLTDVLQQLSTTSISFQKSSSVLIRKDVAINTLLSQLELLKSTNSVSLETFIQHSQCLKSNKWKPCSGDDLNEYDFRTSKTTNLQQFVFTKTLPTRDTTKWPKLKNLRVSFIGSIIQQICSYFPEENLKIFTALDPSFFTDKVANIMKYSKKITCLADRFKTDVQKASQQFSNVLTAILTNYQDDFCFYRQLNDPATFWSHFLKMSLIPWKTEIHHLVEIVLALSVGSADVERSFSIMNHVRYDRRSRLSTKHIEDIVRICINGPEFEDFDVEPYTQHWLKNHIESDSNANIKKTSSNVKTEKKGSKLF